LFLVSYLLWEPLLEIGFKEYCKNMIEALQLQTLTKNHYEYANMGDL
jgi:hypothetical protein